MPKYIVLPNNEVQYGGKENPKVAKPGDAIELTEEEAASISHAVAKPAEAKKAESEAEKAAAEKAKEAGKGK